MPHSVQSIPSGAEPLIIDPESHAACVAATTKAAAVCIVSANAALADRRVADFRRLIRASLDCASISTALAHVLSRHFDELPLSTQWLTRACAQACQDCARSCEQPGVQLLHLDVCAEHCRRAERACRALLDEPAAS